MLNLRKSAAPSFVTPQPFRLSDVYGYQPGNGHNQGRFPNQKQILTDRHILIVEDEAMIGFALEMELDDIGAIPVGPATTLSGALQMLDQLPIDGAILDIDLNGVDVYPLADLLIDRGISFVFHTAHGKRKELRDVYPGVPVCIKPVNTDDVLDALGNVFRDRSRN